MTLNSPLFRGLTVLSLLAPLTSMASSATFANGFYVGAKIGAQQAYASWDGSSISNINVEDQFVQFALTYPDQDAQSFHTNLMGNVNFGYAWIVEQFFLAPEFSVNLASEQELSWRENESIVVTSGGGSSFNTIQSNTRSEVELESPDVIFDLRPGLLLTKNFLFYGRIGVAFNQLSIEQEGNIIDSNSHGDPVTNLTVFSEDDDDVLGFRVGLGMEYMLTPNLALNMDYVFTDYESIDTEFSGSTSNNIGSSSTIITSTVTSEADVTKSTLTAGFNWYFGGKKHTPVYHGPDK